MYSPTSNNTDISSQSSQSAETPKSSNNSSINNNKISDYERRREKLHYPLLYEACVQARVRSGYDLSSQHLTDLPEGSVLTVEEIITNRARISAPICGWLSIISKVGTQIIMPLNKNTEKIGGKVIFLNTKKIKNGNKYKYIPIQAKIIDYNQTYSMHKIQHKNKSEQWISLKDPNIHYIPQNNTCSAYINPIQESEAFFNQFFCTDYPQFKPKTKSLKKKKKRNKRNIDSVLIPKPKTICTKRVTNSDNKIKQSAKAKDKKKEIQKKETKKDVDDEDEKNEEKFEYKQEDKSPQRLIKGHDEFIAKIKEIERRIVDHLHKRGYYEDHPDFWRYIAKAKELAIARAQKEREKLLKRQMLQNQMNNN